MKLIMKSIRNVWRKLPFSVDSKTRFKNFLFKRYSWIFAHTGSYKFWKEYNSAGNLLEENTASNRIVIENNIYIEPVSKIKGSNPTGLPVKLIAFYLPQFHTIPENDEWWGKDFTEWVNVKQASTFFHGHHQPHIPFDLGYYNLRDIEVQRKQIEIAKLYGLGGFCFYFYWFDGHRLLEEPILNYLNDKSLEFPFCLCWANENWSRRWDGLDNETLIGQNHSYADDIAFIQYLAKYLVDSRYIRIDGIPLVLVYRPGLLPNPKKTANRWRQWCHENGIGEIYLAYTQSFENVDPKIYGFDAAIEFPPNNSSPPIVTDNIKSLDPEFAGIIYDWKGLVERSRNYKKLNYKLFRGVCPSWDNTPRRKNKSTIFVNSNPEDFQEWLTNAIEDTVHRVDNQDERLIFVNAWNEWAEGAHLEPDEKYGYAYLQATKNALLKASKQESWRRIVLVGHDAHPHGAQSLLLYLARMLKEQLHFKVDIVHLESWTSFS